MDLEMHWLLEEGHRDLRVITTKNQILSTTWMSKEMDFFLECPERDTAPLTLGFYPCEMYSGPKEL